MSTSPGIRFRMARPSLKRSAAGGGGGRGRLRLGGREVNARAYCAQFGFTGADQQKKVGVLSGGERNRVHLARLLKSGANLILLDEPTNDLDINSIRAIEDGPRKLCRMRRCGLPRPVGFWTGSPATSSPSRATARPTGSRATIRRTLRTTAGARARKRISPTGSNTGS